MGKALSLLLLSLLFGLQPAWGADSPAPQTKEVYVVPIEGQINKAQLFILRRALKEALANKVSGVILKIDTPGGLLNVTLDMMEALGKFTGDTFAFVDDEAISAGAYISAACNKIYMAPNGLIGAAAVVQSGGQETPETMKKKIDSYLRARVRSISKDFRYRGDVIRAMMDEDFEFKIGNKVLKTKDSLLTLTADEAVVKYGAPPETLLASGIVKSIDDLLLKEYGKDTFKIKDFTITWSEKLAKWLNEITPILLGLGLMALFIEFKTPGFGIFGITGIVLLLTVFLSSYVAGLSGYETILVFCVGVVLLGLELFLFPGTLVLGIVGILLILGSIIWALADTWPTEGFQYTPEIFMGPALDVLIGLVIGIIGTVILGRYVFKGLIWDHLVLKSAVEAQEGRATANVEGPQIGDSAIAVTGLFPSGKIEWKGVRYEARAQIGMIELHSKVEIVGKDGFSYIVKEVK